LNRVAPRLATRIVRCAIAIDPRAGRGREQYPTSWPAFVECAIERSDFFSAFSRNFAYWPAQSVSVVTDQTLLVDQLQARTQQLERELAEARSRHKRDVALLRAEFAEAIRTQLARDVVSSTAGVPQTMPELAPQATEQAEEREGLLRRIDGARQIIS